ncbi:MAG: hypothetical protein K5799_15290 [Erythrobacter sp.]|nr:hypothetical protein [Erythrobacter sp.]
MAHATRDQLDGLEADTARDGYGVIGLPDTIPEGGGSFHCTPSWSDDVFGGGINDIDFSWDGMRYVTFVSDIAQALPDLSPMSSSPCVGWVHWLRNGDLLVAFANDDDSEFHGWAVVPDAVQYEDEGELQDPRWWARLLVKIDRSMYLAGSRYVDDQQEEDGRTYYPRR